MTTPLDVVRTYLEARGVPFEAVDGGVVSFPAVATNGTWPVFVNARADADVVVIHSLVGELVPPELRTPMALFLTRANFGLLVGNFELDLDDGELRYKTSADVRDGGLTEAAVDQLLLANVAITDRYLPGIRAVLDGVDPATAVAQIEAAAR